MDLNLRNIDAYQFKQTVSEFLPVMEDWRDPYKYQI